MKVIDKPRKARKSTARSPMPFLHRAPGGGERPVREFHTLHEMAVAARLNLTAAKWDTLCGGSDSEMTMRRNRHALDCLALRQRVLVDVSVIDTTTKLLGETLPIPVFAAPVGNFLQLGDPQGAVAVARGTAAFGSTAFISTAVQPDFETVAQSVEKPLIFQLYVRSDRAWVEEILQRAKAAGYRAICVTADRAYYGRRERDLANRFLIRETSSNPRFQASLAWRDLEWIRACVDLPLIVKGISTAEDAGLAAEHGVEAIYVSNHGGRQLDQGQASIDVLPEVVEATDGRAEILFDGGVMRGTDVLKAIALGASAVGVGRLQGLALAAAGEAGITRMFEILEAEIRTAMGLMGVSALAQLDGSWVRSAQPVPPVQGMSVYPYSEDLARGPYSR